MVEKLGKQAFLNETWVVTSGSRVVEKSKEVDNLFQASFISAVLRHFSFSNEIQQFLQQFPQLSFYFLHFIYCGIFS